MDEGAPVAAPAGPDRLAEPNDLIAAAPAGGAGPSGRLAEPRGSVEPETSGQGGDAELSAALDQFARLPLTEHAERYEQLHAHLQARLAEIDSA